MVQKDYSERGSYADIRRFTGGEDDTTVLHVALRYRLSLP